MDSCLQWLNLSWMSRVWCPSQPTASMSPGTSVYTGTSHPTKVTEAPNTMRHTRPIGLPGHPLRSVRRPLWPASCLSSSGPATVSTLQRALGSSCPRPPQRQPPHGAWAPSSECFETPRLHSPHLQLSRQGSFCVESPGPQACTHYSFSHPAREPSAWRVLGLPQPKPTSAFAVLPWYPQCRKPQVLPCTHLSFSRPARTPSVPRAQDHSIPIPFQLHLFYQGSPSVESCGTPSRASHGSCQPKSPGTHNLHGGQPDTRPSLQV